MKQQWITAAAAAATLLASACSGGAGGSGTALPSVAHGTSSQLTATATFTLSIPHTTPLSGARKAKYLTPAVAGIDFQVTQDLSGTGTTQAAPNDRGYVFYAVTPQSTYCVNGSTALTCTLPVQAYPGADLITVTTYDSTNPSTPRSGGGSSHIISTGYVTANIVPGVDNPIGIVTRGVVSSMTAGLDTPFPAMGVATTQPLRLIAMDYNYNIIIGAYDMPLQATSPDTTGKITFSSSTITSSAAMPNVVYNGATGASYTYLKVNTTSPLTTENTYYTYKQTFVPLGPGATGLYPTPATVQFAHANSASQTVSVALANTTGSVLTVDPTKTDNLQNPACNGIVTASLSGSTVTITPVKAGSCGLWLGGGVLSGGNYSSTGTVPIVVSP